jgi:RNA polymerase sigma factor (sigma-70 family)
VTPPFRSEGERRLLIWEAIARYCTARQALVLRMRHFDCMTVEQIAVELGVSERTVHREINAATRMAGRGEEVAR